MTIQRVKDKVIGARWSGGYAMPAETKGQVLAAIEKRLSGLPVEELPESELVIIAEGIRDRIYQPIAQAQQRVRKEENRKQDQARQRTVLIAFGVAHANRALREQRDLDGWTRLDVEQKVKRVLEKETDGTESKAATQSRVEAILSEALELMGAKRTDKVRQGLIEHGVAYLTRELASEEDLDAGERLSIEREVKQDLAEELTGEESKTDVEAFVDEALDDILGETEEGDEENEVDDEHQWGEEDEDD